MFAKTSTIQNRDGANTGSMRTLFLIVAVLIFGNILQEASAQTHQLRERGKTLVEGEDFGATSDDPPRIEENKLCSEGKALAYFWANSWFELKLDAPRMLNYTLSLRTSSEAGSRIEIQVVDASQKEKSIATIDVPKTGSWTTYINTKDVTISLPGGAQILRFKNLDDGANIDYITFSAGDYDDVVAAQPNTNTGPGLNPMKGFNSGWWRPDEDHASVGFQYIEWRKLEPKDDEFNWDNVEEVLNRPGSKGKHFILQLAVDWDDWAMDQPVGDSHYKGPDWLLEKVGENTGPAYPDDPDSRISRATRYNDPVFIEEATEAIEALLGHYKDDPRTFVVQVGVLGYWGEWHNYPRKDWSPTKSTKFAILNAYTKNLGTDGLTQVRYPDEPVAEPQSGMGYANGSATLTDHGHEFGEAIAKGELWKNGPIGGEWPPNVELKHFEKFFLSNEGKSFIDKGRYSTLLPPEGKKIVKQLPGWTPDGLFMEMHRQMGYNFQVKSVRHLVSVDDSQQTHIEVDLHNAGIAPFYKDWDVQLAILKTETSEVVGHIDVDTDIRKLGPGETISIAGSIAGSADEELDPNVDYQIGIRILQPGADVVKDTAWGLDARNTYIVLANDVAVIEGVWNEQAEAPNDRNALLGGWNILDSIERRQPVRHQPLAGKFFPLDGSFRPISSQPTQSQE